MCFSPEKKNNILKFDDLESYHELLIFSLDEGIKHLSERIGSDRFECDEITLDGFVSYMSEMYKNNINIMFMSWFFSNANIKFKKVKGRKKVSTTFYIKTITFIEYIIQTHKPEKHFIISVCSFINKNYEEDYNIYSISESVLEKDYRKFINLKNL